MEFGENLINSDNLRDSEEGIEVKLFLQTLKRIYHVNEAVGTYVCSKMKNFMNNYRHKTKRLILEGLIANKIISSKVNDIIDTSLKESNFEKVFESLSDIYYCGEFSRSGGNPVCKVQPQKNQMNPLVCPEVQPHISGVHIMGGEALTESHNDSIYRPTGETSRESIAEGKKTKRVQVEIGKDTHTIHLKEFNTITSLKKFLVEELHLGKNELKSMDIKYYSEGLKRWTNLRSWKILKKDETIKVCPHEIKQENQHHLKTKDPLSIEPQDPPPLLYHKNKNLELPGLLEKRVEEIMTEYKSAGGKKSWVFDFKLPKFEDKFSTQMEKGEINSKERIQICLTIQEHVAQHDRIPASREIEVIVKILFLTYPKLAEMDKDYWVTWNIWKVSLCDAFMKRREREVERVKRKSIPSDSSSSSNSSHEAKKKNAIPSNFASSSSFSSQKVELNPDSGEVTMEVVPSEETSRNVAFVGHLSPAMELTFEERRRQIVDEGWTIQDILISYPWLHNESEIFAEFSRIVNLDKAVDKAIDAGFRKIVYAVLHSLKSHAKYRTVLEKEKELRKDTDRKGGLRDFEYKMALFALPFAFGEDIEDIFKQEGSVYEEPIQIEFSGSSRYEDGKSYAVIIEDAKVECSSLKKAIAVFVAAFFIFNLAYPSDIKKFLYFIERNLLGIPGKALPPSQVVKLVKKIDEYIDNKMED